MPHDWHKPFPRTALLIVHPDTGEVVLSRTKDMIDTEIPDGTYQMIEQERKDWLDKEILKAREQLEVERAEYRVLKERQMFRDSQVGVAQQVKALLNGWAEFVDIARWRQLQHWLESHPQRWNDFDHLLAMVDDQLAHYDVRPKAAARGRTGRPKGTKNTAESNRIRSARMKERWAEMKANGNVPKVGRPRSEDQKLQVKKAPY